MIPQSDPAWATARLGHVTASRIADMRARTKSGWGASRYNYASELIVERLTGAPGDRYVNAAMQHGIDTEPQARLAYEIRHDVSTGQAGFVKHPSIAWAGASPDGFVQDDGLVEFKCPNTATHIETLRSGAVAEKYLQQMQWQMAVTGRQWCDYVSFDPRLPEGLRLFVQRIERDNAFISQLEADAEEFLAEEVEKVIRELSDAYQWAVAA